MSNTTEQNFRSNLSQFRWSRGNNDDSQQSESTPANNPFSRFYNAIASGGGYVPLRSSDRSNEEEAYFALSRWDRCVPATLNILRVLTNLDECRLLGFGGCLIGAVVCFFVSFLTLPMIALRPSKFALSFRYATYSSTNVSHLNCRQAWARYSSCSGTSPSSLTRFMRSSLVQVCRPHWPGSAHQAPCIQRTSPVLDRVPIKSGVDSLFLIGCTFLLMLCLPPY